MNADSISITKNPAHLFNVYVNSHTKETRPDTIYNYQIDVIGGDSYEMNFYFSLDEIMDSCIIHFSNDTNLQNYLVQYLQLTCPYDWLQLDQFTYIQTNDWARKLKTNDPQSNEKQKLIGSRVINLCRTVNDSLPIKLKISIPLMDYDTWKNKTQANKK